MKCVLLFISLLIVNLAILPYPRYVLAEPAPASTGKGDLTIYLQVSSPIGDQLIAKSGGYVSLWGPYLRGTPEDIKNGNVYQVPPGQQLRQIKGIEGRPGVFSFTELPTHIDTYDPDSSQTWEYQLVKWGHPALNPKDGFYIYKVPGKDRSTDAEFKNIKVRPRFTVQPYSDSEVYLSGEHALHPKSATTLNPDTLLGGTTKSTTSSSSSTKPRRGPEPYTILFITDSESTKKAKLVSVIIRDTFPFKGMGDNLRILVHEVSRENFICRQINDIGHVQCFGDYFLNLALQLKAHQIVLFPSHVQFGTKTRSLGGHSTFNGMISYVNPNSTPYESILAIYTLHELGHSIAGLADEYPSPSNDYKALCLNDKTRHTNATRFTSRSSYTSENQARKLHSKDIPWYPFIHPNTKITHKLLNRDKLVLGTNYLPPDDRPALYRGGFCSPWTPSWLPYDPKLDPSIMNNKAEKILRRPDLDTAIYIHPVHALSIHAAMSHKVGKFIPLTGGLLFDISIDGENDSNALRSYLINLYYKLFN